ncbi:MAG: aldose 1-epimerase family protein [Candidatus Dormibacter sp.]|uniref:aldose 1-epimerase family protein n=1 Tax=Candidatus Dormibacter sp. TaxID=2973982 RepID=UPI000DB22F8C|nr:MAG: aldose epimerase [Candidatus Dormibacteraeota bacterium]
MTSRLSPNGAERRVSFGDQEAFVVEAGGALRDYRVAGRSYLDHFGPDEMSTAARGHILMPWPNRLRAGSYTFGGEQHQLPISEPDKRSALHGLVRWDTWQLLDAEPASVSVTHQLLPRDGYPFSLATTVTYSLSPQGLTVASEVFNNGSAALPFGAGFHPYFRVGAAPVDGWTLELPAERRLQLDGQGIPTGTEEELAGSDFDFRRPRLIGALKLDTAFTGLSRGDDGLARARLSASDGGQLTVWMDAAFDHIMVFSGDVLPHPEQRRSLAIEPMTCAPNALQEGTARTLQPGERWDFRWGVEPGRVSS